MTREQINAVVVTGTSREQLEGKLGLPLWSRENANGEVRAGYLFPPPPPGKTVVNRIGGLTITYKDGKVLRWAPMTVSQQP